MKMKDTTTNSSKSIEEFEYLFEGRKEGQFEQHFRLGSTANTEVCEHIEIDKDS